jgi:hypothetical protein
MKNVKSFDTNQVLDRNTLCYLYRHLFRLLIQEKQREKDEYSKGKIDAYVGVMRIVNDILDS